MPLYQNLKLTKVQTNQYFNWINYWNWQPNSFSFLIYWNQIPHKLYMRPDLLSFSIVPNCLAIFWNCLGFLALLSVIKLNYFFNCLSNTPIFFQFPYWIIADSLTFFRQNAITVFTHKTYFDLPFIRDFLTTIFNHQKPQ